MNNHYWKDHFGVGARKYKNLVAVMKSHSDTDTEVTPTGKELGLKLQ